MLVLGTEQIFVLLYMKIRVCLFRLTKFEKFLICFRGVLFYNCNNSADGLSTITQILELGRKMIIWTLALMGLINYKNRCFELVFLYLFSLVFAFAFFLFVVHLHKNKSNSKTIISITIIYVKADIANSKRHQRLD